MKFSNEVINEIKSYVYIYTNPNTNKVFYIGKGKGNRCFEHLEEKSDSEKVKVINQLRANGQEPIIEILRYGLTDSQASLIESVLIDFIGLENLTNEIRGLHSRTFGRMSIEDINIKYTADDTIVTDDVIAITINQLFYSGITEEELYEATRGVWKIGKRRNKAKYAFAIFEGVIREVYQIEQWHKSGTLEYRTRNSTEFKNLQRWEFSGKIATNSIRNKYLNKSIKKYLSKGSQNPIKYINC